LDARAWIVLGVSCAYLVGCLVIGLWPSSKSSDSAAGFVAGDRALGGLLMYFITGATIFSSFTFLGLPGWAATRGAASFYILSYGILGFVPFYFLGTRAARLGRRFGYVTQAEMVAGRFGAPYLALAFALVSLIAFVPYLALQIQGAGLMLNSVSGGAIGVRLGGAAVYAVVAIYVVRSGVLGVGWTNVFQGLLMLGMAWGLGLWLPFALHGGVGEMFERIATERPELLRAPGLSASGAPWTWAEYSSSIAVSMIGFTCWPHLFMKAFSARDERTLKRTVVVYPTFLLFQVPILLIGYAAVFHEPAAAHPDQTLPHLLMGMDLPAIVIGLFCAGGLAASMSSGDAMAHASASIAVRDGLVTGLGRRLTPHRERSLIRMGILLVLVASYVVAGWYGDSIVGLLLFAYGPVTQFAPGLVATLYWRRASAPGVLAGLVLGILVNLVFAHWSDLRPWPLHAGVYGLAANALALVAVSLATRREDERSGTWLAVAADADAGPPRG
jgi:SSS family solute:Na+ symporter